MPCAVLIFSKIGDEHYHDMKKRSHTIQKILYLLSENRIKYVYHIYNNNVRYQENIKQ